ncbi:MAG: DUF4102 domain-containing protein [Rubrivivax sp.]|nr:MAG: DUF4102 domain-containing protein [Rubrivivax sp.]
MFDPREAKLLEPGSHLTIDGHPGLRLEASEKYRTWTYRYKSPVDGRMRQFKLGQWPTMTFAAAMGEWEKARVLREAGQDPAQEKRAARAAAVDVAKQRRENQVMTVGRVCYDFYEKVAVHRRKPAGAAELKRQFDKMLGPDADLPAATYTRAQAYALLERWAHAPVTCRNFKQELGAAWDRALDAGDLPENTPNWWRMIMRGKLQSKGKKINGVHIGVVKRTLNDREVGELIRWLPNFTSLVRDALTLYLWTGCRGSEIMQIEAREISEEGDGLWWTIPKIKTKNSRREDAGDLRVPLVGRAVEVVRRRLQLYPQGYLFASKAKAGHTEQDTIQVTTYYHMPYCRTRPEVDRHRLPVTHWSPHDLRRTVRTKLAMMGCPDAIAEAVLGHMQPGIKGIYNRHQYDKERRIWLTLLSEQWESLAQTN